MRRLLLCLLGACSFMAAAQAQPSPIDELASEYDEVAQQLSVYAKLAERATESGTRLEDVDRLANQVHDVKQHLALLAARLKALKDANKPTLKLTLGDHNGPPLAQIVDPRDSVAASIEIPAKGGTATWRLHGPTGMPVGASKKEEGIPNVGYYLARTSFKAAKLDKGDYKLVFDYQPIEAEAIHAEAGFTVDIATIELKPFALKTRLGQYDGPPIARPLRNGDIVASSADVILAGKPEKPEVGSLVWRLVDAAGTPVPRYEKSTQTYEKSGLEQTRYRIQLNDLADGEYRIQLIHQLANDPAGAVKAEAGFTYRQPVRITRLVVADAPAATENRNDFRSHEKPYLFAYLSLRPEEEGAQVDLVLKRSDGSIVQTKSGNIVRKGDEQRAGMQVENRLAPGSYHFEATLRAGEGSVHSTQSFSVSDYALAVSAPNAVQSGEYGRFNIQLPNEFVQPVRVEVDGTSNTLIRHADNGLSGSVSGIAAESPGTGRVKIAVSDAEGRIAKGSFEFSIWPIPKPDPVPEPGSYASTPSPTYSPPETHKSEEPDKPRAAPTPKKDPYDGFMAIINEMNKQQAELKRAQDAAEKARQAAAAAGSPSIYRAPPVTIPSWMQQQPVPQAAGPQAAGRGQYLMTGNAKKGYKCTHHKNLPAGFRCVSDEVCYWADSCRR